MPRYFFDVHDGVDIVDAEGTELPGLEAVREEAIAMSGATIQELGAKFWSAGEWRLDVRDTDGVHVLTLRFSAS